MNLTDQPTYSILPTIVPELRAYFDIALLVFAVCFFAGVHYRMHVIQHLVPPPYMFWLRDLFRRLFR